MRVPRDADEDDRRTVVLEPDDRRSVRAEEATDLLADGREDLGRAVRPCATSVASRRSAACSSASCPSSAVRSATFYLELATRPA